MLADTWKVIWTEWAECFFPDVRLKSAGVIMAAPLAGVIMSLPWGLDWYSSGRWGEHFVTFTAGVAWLATIGFALRDRNRRGLEALVAGGRSRDAILFGKIGASVGFGLAFWLVMSAVSVAALNLMQADGPWAFVPLSVTLMIVAVEFLISVSGGTGATLIALGASTAGQVYKVAFAFLGALALAVFIVARISEAWSTVLITELQRVSVPMQFAIVFMVTFAFLDIVLILFAQARFKKAQVIPNRFGR